MIYLISKLTISVNYYSNEIYGEFGNRYVIRSHT